MPCCDLLPLGAERCRILGTYTQRAGKDQRSTRTRKLPFPVATPLSSPTASGQTNTKYIPDSTFFNLHLDVAAALVESGRAFAGDGATKSRLHRRIAKGSRPRREFTRRHPTPGGRAIAMVLPRRRSKAECRRGGHEGWDDRTCCCERHLRGTQGCRIGPRSARPPRSCAVVGRDGENEGKTERW